MSETKSAATAFEEIYEALDCLKGHLRRDEVSVSDLAENDLTDLELRNWLTCAEVSESASPERHRAADALRSQADTLIPRLLREVQRRRIEAQGPRLDLTIANDVGAWWRSEAKRLEAERAPLLAELEALRELHKGAAEAVGELSEKLDRAESRAAMGETETASLRSEVQRLQAEVRWLRAGEPMKGETPPT